MFHGSDNMPASCCLCNSGTHTGQRRNISIGVLGKGKKTKTSLLHKPSIVKDLTYSMNELVLVRSLRLFWCLYHPRRGGNTHRGHNIGNTI